MIGFTLTLLVSMRRRHSCSPCNRVYSHHVRNLSFPGDLTLLMREHPACVAGRRSISFVFLGLESEIGWKRAAPKVQPHGERRSRLSGAQLTFFSTLDAVC